MNYYAVKKKPSIDKNLIHIGKSSWGWKFLFQGYQDKELNWQIQKRHRQEQNNNPIPESLFRKSRKKRPDCQRKYLLL